MSIEQGFVVQSRKVGTDGPWDLLELGTGTGAHVLVFKSDSEAREHARVERCTGYEERVVRATLSIGEVVPS